MPKREILTRTEIEKDIISGLKQPKDSSQASHEKETVVGIILAVLLVVIEFFYHLFVLWFLLALVAFLIFGAIFLRIRLQYRIKKVSIDDYQILTDTVSYVFDEKYHIRGSKYSSGRWVHNHDIVFESGRKWSVPKQNYPWSDRQCASDSSVFATAHRGDAFITVIKKDTDAIAVAYHTEHFEYKGI